MMYNYNLLRFCYINAANSVIPFKLQTFAKSTLTRTRCFYKTIERNNVNIKSRVGINGTELFRK